LKRLEPTYRPYKRTSLTKATRSASPTPPPGHLVAFSLIDLKYLSLAWKTATERKDFAFRKDRAPLRWRRATNAHNAPVRTLLLLPINRRPDTVNERGKVFERITLFRQSSIAIVMPSTAGSPTQAPSLISGLTPRAASAFSPCVAPREIAAAAAQVPSFCFWHLRHRAIERRLGLAVSCASACRQH
jgi:hypothetical protein